MTSRTQRPIDEHPHPDARHIVSQYRKHVLSAKRKFGSARALIHYEGYVRTYLSAKRRMFRERR